MDKHNTPEELIRKYNAGTCTDEERAIVESWHLADIDQSNYKPSAESIEAVNVRMREVVLTHAGTRRQIKLWPRIAVAAAVAAIMFGVWFYYTPRHPDAGQDPVSAQYANDIAPGKNTATLTLASGKVIQLSDAKSGVIVGKDLKYSDNTLVIQSGSEGSGSPGTRDGKGTERITAATPRGGTYQVVLPDGSKVWLNADSKISFPSQFDGSERNITLAGEAYFEIAKDKAHPFIVESNGQEVTVLGTHFNVNSYEDEGVIKTTLLEGSVRVNDVTLKPNQQSIITKNNSQVQVRAVDVNDVIDWKNGDFILKGETLEAVMRKVSRWYKVDVSYADDAPRNLKLGGFVSRSRNISAVLDLIERTGQVKFKVQGNMILVVKQ